jgi:hypothetical protein
VATKIKYVEPKDVKILNKYFDGSEGITLIFPHAQRKAKDLGLEDGECVEYDFGGDADVWLDLAYDEDHLIFHNSSDKVKGG